MKTVLYLASQSPRRKTILRKLKIPFRVIASSYKEKNIPGLRPEELVMLHALGKAKKARLPKKGRFVLAADTLVWHRGHTLGKPKREREAFEMLSLLSGRTHFVYTGVVLFDKKTGRIWKKVDRTRVKFKKVSDDFIRKYVRKVHSFDKAGGYAIQERPKIVQNIKGSYSNVMGLPEEIVRDFYQTKMKGII